MVGTLKSLPVAPKQGQSATGNEFDILELGRDDDMSRMMQFPGGPLAQTDELDKHDDTGKKVREGYTPQ